jgi:uncharacterized 2Fe-2S/4Fe-4S cluster protein (DUF4445 family)
MDNTDEITFFLDVGTNGEMVWAAGMAGHLRLFGRSAFEGAGWLTACAHKGAIEEVWVSSGAPTPFEPTYRVIGTKPRICGSGLISLPRC